MAVEDPALVCEVGQYRVFGNVMGVKIGCGI